MLSKYLPGMIHTVELAEFFGALRTQMLCDSSAIARNSDDWNGNMGFYAALDAAEFGKWNPPAIASLTIPELQGEAEEMLYSYDVTGQTLDIASYLTGEPECWQTEEPVRKPCGRIIRLAVEIGGLYSVEATQLANRGQAIIALVNSLELAGHSVEVTVIRAYKTADQSQFRFLIPIKHAGQALDTKRLQFILGHPAFFRRCLFGFSEIANGVNLSRCMTFTQHFQPEGFVYIPSNEGLMSTLGASLEWAKRLAASLTDAATLVAAN